MKRLLFLLSMLLFACSAIAEPKQIVLDQEVSSDTVDPIVKAISEGPVSITINSPGGDVISGLNLVHAIQNSKWPVSCRVQGMAASMAAVIFESCDVRAMTPDSFLMFHPVSAGAPDRVTPDALREVAEEMRILSHALSVISCRKIQMGADECEAKIMQTWWLSADEALDAQAADSVSWK